MTQKELHEDRTNFGLEFAETCDKVLHEGGIEC